MSRRFFVDVPITGESANLSGAEAQHLSKVMRVRIGDEVTLFDGSGGEFTARVDRIERSSVSLRVLSRSDVNRELPFELTMGVALPKGERQQWLTEKLTELGVTRLVPLVTSRGVAQPSDNSIARLKRAVIEASKQCGRNRLMEIAAPIAFDDFVADRRSDSVRWLAHPTGSAVGAESRLILDPRILEPASVAVAIGPEGGFAEQELEAAGRFEWQAINLGLRVLRVETAAISIAAAIVFGVR